MEKVRYWVLLIISREEGKKINDWINKAKILPKSFSWESWDLGKEFTIFKFCGLKEKQGIDIECCLWDFKNKNKRKGMELTIFNQRGEL